MSTDQSIISQRERNIENLGIDLATQADTKLFHLFLAEAAVRLCPPLSFRHIAKKYGVSVQWISQLVEKYYPNFKMEVQHDK